jgi:hypothetical protein
MGGSPRISWVNVATSMPPGIPTKCTRGLQRGLFNATCCGGGASMPYHRSRVFRIEDATTVAETEFERELEIFRTEEETAQQYFFSYLSVRSLAATNGDVLKMINTTPWITAHHAM